MSPNSSNLSLSNPWKKALRKKVQVKGSRKGIKTEVNLMSSYQACPDRTHLKPVKRSAFCISRCQIT
ncbi:hypothetical protein HanXRQr2_Chr12g0537311 [Helianthus annuus]|uniref:Uncharacterized protein n=1 Tax=Helianthus annuus TaxID=4232 RepID=A0A251T1T5_HELAN|nr:hypothetical protein HanXRQr2_Chr12g0537311 [Helianthus annuus]